MSELPQRVARADTLVKEPAANSEVATWAPPKAEDLIIAGDEKEITRRRNIEHAAHKAGRDLVRPGSPPSVFETEAVEMADAEEKRLIDASNALENMDFTPFADTENQYKQDMWQLGERVGNRANGKSPERAKPNSIRRKIGRFIVGMLSRA